MKTTFLLWIALLSTGAAMAQTDSSYTAKKSDTIRIGGMIIIKRKGPNEKSTSEVTWTKKRSRVGHKNVETNYLIMDLGFSNFTDNSDYSSAAVKNYARPVRAGEAAFTKK